MLTKAAFLNTTQNKHLNMYNSSLLKDLKNIKATDHQHKLPSHNHSVFGFCLQKCTDQLKKSVQSNMPQLATACLHSACNFGVDTG